MELSKKQIEFAELMVENIIEGISPIIKKYIDMKITNTKKEILAEIRNVRAPVSKLNEVNQNIKKQSTEFAENMFTDEDFQESYKKLESLSPKDLIDESAIPQQSKVMDGVDLESLTINYNHEVSMDSVLNLSEQVTTGIANGTYVNPGQKIISGLETQDFSKFLD